jgi:two-component system, cell cycle sensor histidine kinase and response regulator CckA
MNLVLNARDAISENGTITISTDAKLLPGSSEPAVCLAVADTGCGMDTETRSHLFEPFFTTKAQGHGTGLGLATVLRIVTENGGAIAVESEPGRGTKIEVCLPVTKPVLAVPASEGDTPC